MCLALAALTDIQIFAEGGGYLLLFTKPPIKQCLQSSGTDTPAMVCKGPQKKGEVTFKLNRLLRSCAACIRAAMTHCANKQTRCWRSCTIAHPVVVIILIMPERRTGVRRHSWLPASSLRFSGTGRASHVGGSSLDTVVHPSRVCHTMLTHGLSKTARSITL